MAENVQINFGIKSDTKQAQSDIKALERALSSLQGVANQIGKGQSISNYGAQIKAAANEVADIRGKMQIASAMDKFVDNPTVENLYKFTRTVESEYNRVERAAKQTAKSVKQSNDEMGGSASRANGVFSNFFGSLTRIAKLRLLRGIIRMVTQAFREGTTNIYQYSAAMNNTDASGFSGQMNSLASSFLYLKNSIGAVVAPLLSSLVPALQTVIGWVTSALNVLAQFFAVLNGQSTYTKAKQVATEWQAVGSAAGGAAAAAKEYKNTIMSFDEIHALNDISDSGGGGGGGGAGSPNYGDMFEEAELATTGIAGAFNRLAAKLKPILGGVWEFTKNTIETIFDGFGLAFDALFAVISGDAEEIKRVVNEMGVFISKHPVLKWISNAARDASAWIRTAIDDVKLWFWQAVEDVTNFLAPILKIFGWDIDELTGKIDDQKRAIIEHKVEIAANKRQWHLWADGVDLDTAHMATSVNVASAKSILALNNMTSSAKDTSVKIDSVTNSTKYLAGYNYDGTNISDGLWGAYNSAVYAEYQIKKVKEALEALSKGTYTGLTVGITAAVIGAKANGGYVNGYEKGGMIPRYDSGGINSADLFMANESGNPELVGRIGSRTAVANQGQMVEAIAEGLSRALADMSDNGTSNIEVVVNMDGVAVARASDRGQRKLNRRFNVQLA